MLKGGDTVMVAVSGGPDSVFLLHALNKLKDKLRIAEIHACHLDHGLRGRESRDDADFVKKLCGGLRIRLTHQKINLKQKKSTGLSTEESAREERYRFFREAAAGAGADAIATGHTLDDQAETVLMRLIKGASLKGIAGIPPVRAESGLRFIRPALELEKAAIREYLDREGIAYRIDSTNLKPLYLRNIVRGEIIPFLERYNPRLKRALFSLAEHLREDYEFIKEARKGLPFPAAGPKPAAGRLELRLKDLVVQPKALQKEILRDALEKAGGEVKRLSFRHWKDIEDLIRRKRKGKAVDLPGGIRIERTPNALRYSRL
jgi:tRNA(Ile)-lysidine synthase